MRIHWKTLPRSFFGDRRGNFVVTLALLLLPMLGVLGIAIDFSLALRTKTALDASTDAAVLAAATEAQQIIQSQSTANYDATPAAIAAGQVAGQQVFSANSAMLKTVSTPVLNLNLQRSGLTISASGSYSAQAPTVFGSMFGTSVMSASGTAVSTVTLPKYLNIYIAVDISQSMGIAATQAAMTQLASYTSGCVFGCHVVGDTQDPSIRISYEQVARNHSIPLRIDVVKQSIQNMIASAQGMSNGKPLIQFGLYTLQYDVATLSPLSTNYPNLLTAAGSIDLGSNDHTGIGDSNFTMSVADFAAQVPASGDGSSANSPQNIVFIMTDGVSDVKGNCTDGHCTGPFSPALCSALKARNVTVGVIYTTYIPFPNEQTYRDLVQPFAANIAPNLSSCATSGYYYEASDGPAIQSAANALFAQATSAERLTQ